MFFKKKVSNSKIEKKLEQAKHINCDINIGLTDADVLKRKDEGLVNEISKKVTKSIWKILKDNVINFFNILLFTIAIFMAIAQLPLNYYIFLVVAILNILIGIFQDLRARHLSKTLTVVSYPYANVLRNGKIVKITANDLVFSDIVVLKAGDQVIIDGTVLDGNLEVNESLLTGESNNIIKRKNDEVFSGSFVTSGTAKIRVEKLGKANYAEKITSKARLIKKRKSEILDTLNKIFKFIGFFVIFFALAQVITYLIRGDFANDAKGTIAFLSGSLVTMIPAGMYLLTSSTLAVGVIQLAKKRMLVQEMYCIEMLARVDVLCFDKTGTITDGTMNVKNIVTLSSDSEEKVGSIINTLISATKDSNATAVALKNRFSESPLLNIKSSIPFNSKRKFSAVCLSDGKTYILGAREFLNCESLELNNKCEKFEKEGLRVLLLASVDSEISLDKNLPQTNPIAIIVLEDHIRPDAISNIAWFKNNGVQIKIISGDNPVSVSEIAKRVGVDNSDRYISLEGKTIEEVKEIADSYTVFGRVSPEQKEALVVAMQQKGHKVAMTGDGVNDILALKAADCSIAMASGSDAAKNVSHLVTLDSNFSSLPDVVAQGRRVINNLQRTCSLFLVKTTFAILISLIFLIISWGNPLIIYPFETKQMYVWEFCTIGVASLFLSFQPNNERLEKNSFISNIITKSIPAGIIQVLIAVIFYTLAFNNAIKFETAHTFSTIVFSLTSFIILFDICWRFDKYRSILFCFLILLCVGMFTFDILMPYTTNASGKLVSCLIGIDYTVITVNNWWYLLIATISAIPVFIIFKFIVKKIQFKIESKRTKGEVYESI